jgi:hypothetical protein
VYENLERIRNAVLRWVGNKEREVKMTFGWDCKDWID